MSAERDVQRLVTHWLAEEAEVRAPDRVLESARRTIDRTRQRRFVVAWREPMYVSPFRLATAAAVVAVALVGAVFLGRITATPGVGGVPTSSNTPAPTPDDQAAFVAYRDARDEICTRYTLEADPLKVQFGDGLYEAGLTPAERATKVDALVDFVSLYDRLIGELEGLEPSPGLAGDHAANVARLDDLRNLIQQIVTAVRQGDLAGAQSIDLATESIAADFEAFEREHVLVNCP